MKLGEHGMSHRASSEITENPIRLDELAAAAGDESFGATVLFVGTVRSRGGKESLGRKVLGISYDVHRALAEKCLGQILAETLKSCPEARLFVVHRVGYVPAGEPSIAILSSSPHREEAYRASRDVIEEIKRRVPIWKKEHYEGGESAWLGGTALDRGTP